VPAAAPPTTRPVIGLLGGIAAGKSTVSALLKKLGPGRVVDADALARTALEACARDGRLASALGPWAVTKAGVPDRKAIAAKVFADPAALRALERITHPAITAAIDEAVNDHRMGRGEPILILDVPLLLEAGLDRRCDALWFIDAPDAARFARAMERLGLSRDDVERRESAQSPLERKRARADYTIENAGAQEALAAQVEAGLVRLGWRPPVRR
jgi:dephospho-CoA kinase